MKSLLSAVVGDKRDELPSKIDQAQGDVGRGRAGGPGGDRWGIPPDSLGAGYPARDIFSGERAQQLEFRRRYYYCRQHDGKAFDMSGAPLGGGTAPSTPGFPGAMPFLATSGEPRYVALNLKRPNAPYRLARSIVKAFTGMLWGENRWPQIRSDDPETQAFCEAVVKAANVKNRLYRARNIGGACGSSGLSWLFRVGRPVVHVHSGRFCEVLEWEDVDEFVPRHVTELYQAFARKTDDEGNTVQCAVWQRKDWTPEANVVFKPVEVTDQDPPAWVVDEDRSFAHGDGFCHFVWVPNFPDDEEPGAVDGQPDYAELYEQLDTLDGVNSILVTGTLRNLDPTLVIKRESPDQVKGIRKGSDNAIVTDPTGDARYLTLDPGMVEAGEKVVTINRRQILEVAQCVIADPNEVAAAGTSSLTMKLVYAPMIGATDLLREPGGTALVRLLEQMQRSARRLLGLGDEPANDDQPAAEEEGQGPELPEDEGPDAGAASGEGGAEPEVLEAEDLDPEDREPETVAYYLDLPPRIISEPEVGPDGKPTGQVAKRKVEQRPGSGKIELEWGDYFPPTSDDKQKSLTTYATAAGGKGVLSQQTAVEASSALLNKDATEEWQRVQQEAARQQFDAGGAGGQVADEHVLPEGDGKPAPAPEPEEAPEGAGGIAD